MNGAGNRYVFGYGSGQLESGMLPVGIVDSTPAADSGLTYSIPVSRKRSRDTSSFDPSILSFQNTLLVNQKKSFTFLDHDISMQIYQQQFEIDQFISNHMEKMRLEMEATRRRNAMRLISAIEEGMKKKLRSKEEEMNKIGRLNYALEEKVKSLNVENQLWQQMAETSEATANVLRQNLQQVLSQNQQQQHQLYENDDVESCCGSNNGNGKMLTEDGLGNGNNNGSRGCRNCGKRESNVLVLPCRHLCICSVCQSSINFCPLCKSAKNATLNVNMS